METSITLFQNYVTFPPDGRVLVVNVDDDRFIGEIAAKAGAVQVYPRYASQFEMLQKRLARYTNVQVFDSVFPTGKAEFDAALIELPKGRDLMRAILYTALRALKPESYVFAAGANQGGAKNAQSDIGELAPTRVLGNKARYRIFSVRRTDNLTLPAEWGNLWEMQTRTFTIRDHDYTVHTQPGVFSWDHLDGGSKYLLETFEKLKVPTGSRILDAGCGYGILGMVAQHELAPKEVVWADDDLLALACTRASLPNETVLGVDLTQTILEPGFDLILCNPPFHREHEKDTGFMRLFARQAAEMLNRHGQVVIVSNAFLPYRDILGDHFKNIRILSQNDQFQILLASG